MKKLYDLAVATGKYTNKSGEEKSNWENVGVIMQKDDGNKMILLKRTFNPAGVPNPDDRDNIILSMFAPKEKTSGADVRTDSSHVQDTPDNPFGDSEEIPF